MARQTLTKTTLPADYATAGVAVTMTAADTVNKEQIVMTGDDVVIIQNTGVGGHTYTINSTGDEHGRTGDMTNVNIAAGAIHVLPRLPIAGWAQSDGTLHLEANHAEVKYGVITGVR